MVNSWRTKQTGFCGFDQAITGAIYFTFHDGKKLSFDRPNHTSIQVFHFKISVKTKRTKQNCFDKTKFFFVTSTCLTSPPEYKYRVISVLVLGVVCTLQKCSWITKCNIIFESLRMNVRMTIIITLFYKAKVSIKNVHMFYLQCM